MVDLTVKVPAIEKLMDYTASGIGAVAGPIFLPWRAFWEGRARRISSQTDADVRHIEAESEARSLPIIAKARSDARQYLLSPDAEVRGTVAITRDDITQRIEFQERKRLANIKSVIGRAADDLGDKEVPDHEPDPDWTARFFDCVQDVSSEDVQRLWAKVLSGEVENPGRTSLRTLDTLRNMTKRDAELFRSLRDFVIRNDFVFYDESVGKVDALEYSKLLHLQDCGLINVGPNLVKQFRWREAREILLMYHNGALILIKNPDAKEPIDVPEVLLTTAGRELSRFCPVHTADGLSASFLEVPQIKELRIGLPGGRRAIAWWKGKVRKTYSDRADV